MFFNHFPYSNFPFSLLQLQDTLSFLVTIKDRVNASGDSENDNIVKVPIRVIVLDENDNAPEFQNVIYFYFSGFIAQKKVYQKIIFFFSVLLNLQVPYETEVLEDAPTGTTVFDTILVTDKDTVGEILNITCIPQMQNPDACNKYVSMRYI